MDNTPPTAIALQNIVVSITSPADQDNGSGKLYVESLDNGSFDGCGPVKLEIRRDTDLCNISGNATYNADGHPEDGNSNPNSPLYDPDEGAFVKFCCEDLYNTDHDVDNDGQNDVGYVKVWLRVWDDGNRDGIFGNEGDTYNEAWAYVKVEDKLAPVITCPPDVTITCADDASDLNVVGEATAVGSCGTAPVEYNDIIVNLNSCNAGFIRRRWNVVGRSDIFCDQTITLEDIEAPTTVSFSQVGDFDAMNCPDIIALGEPTWIAGPCDVISYTMDTDTFLFEDGACYKLVNEYTVINWCDYDPNDPFWVETDDFSDGIIRHTQIVKVTDETKPVIADCEDKMIEINDHSDSDGDGDVCEAKLVLTNSATDEGSANCPTGWLKWQVFVDLWGDGTNDLEYSSFLPPFDNNFNDTNGNGIPDIYISPTADGDEISIALPDIHGSLSNHKVYWKVTDGCNNITTCDYDFLVIDKKAPTPYCVDISTALMNFDGTVALWASDLNIGSFDNCTSEENLRYTFTDVPPQDDPFYDYERRSSGRIFNCNDLANSPVEVRMYVWDEKDNADFCVVSVTIVDNSGICGDGNRVAGNVSTENGENVVDVNVSLMDNLVEYPRALDTDANGDFEFLGIPSNVELEIEGEKDYDYLNGVSTLDLVFIQRHLLELELLDSPYKVIAADINGDEKNKASDLLILRKLILGIIDDIPTNESWRFVDKKQEFEDIYNPWPIDEVLQIDNLTIDKDDNDLIAIKIGDVTNDAETNLKSEETIEKRALESTPFTFTDEWVEQGQEVEMMIRSGEQMNLLGFQNSISLNGLEFVESISKELSLTSDNIGLIEEGLLTMSFHESSARSIEEGSELFALKFIALESGRLSDMITFNSELTHNEIYLLKSKNSGGTVMDITVQSANLETKSIVLVPGNEIEVDMVDRLYQNEPNPFHKQTVIRFDLIEDGEVTLTFMNVSGAIVSSIKIDGKKGRNAFTVDSEIIDFSGLFYYRLESNGFMDTKKMIMVK